LTGWLPWGLLCLTAAWGGAALFGQLPTPQAPEAGVAKGPISAERDRLLGELRPGVSGGRVRELLGPPKQKARQVLHLRYLEQWVYDSPFPVRLEIEYALGHHPQLLTVHPLSPENP
jgi:hypothetical protein